MTTYRDGTVFDEGAPAGRRWCQSADHHEWLHMLLDRRKKDLSDAAALRTGDSHDRS